MPATNHFEMSIEEQAATLLADGLSFSSREPQLNVFATFGAFLEGIAREGFEMWRYQRNLTGLNEGLNVVMHFSHVGACTGRDHFSGWSLDWINLALGYLPFLRRFYAPADARAAFIAVRDAAAGYGGHIVAIPRDNLPVLTQAGWQDAAVERRRRVDGGRRRTASATGAKRRDPHGRRAELPRRRGERQGRGAAACSSTSTWSTVSRSTRRSSTGLPAQVHADHDGRGRPDRDRGRRPARLRRLRRGPACRLRRHARPLRDRRSANRAVGDYLEVWAHYGMTADALAERLL